MSRFGTRAFIVVLAIALFFAAGFAQASQFRPPESEIDPKIFRIDESEYLGVKIKADYALVDHEGKEITMGNLRGAPLILALSYYTCDGFCPTFNMDLKTVLGKVEESGNVAAGRDYKVMTLSFDENDDVSSTHHFRKMIGLDPGLGDHWIMATFKNRDDIKKFTTSLGFKYFWSAPDKMFFHPNAFFFISPEGRVTRILHESLIDSKDMGLAILDAKFNRIQPSEIMQLAVSLCYSYNYKDGKYGLNYPLFFAFGSLFTGISAFFFAAHRLKKRRNRQK